MHLAVGLVALQRNHDRGHDTAALRRVGDPHIAPRSGDAIAAVRPADRVVGQ